MEVMPHEVFTSRMLLWGYTILRKYLFRIYYGYKLVSCVFTEIGGCIEDEILNG